MSSKFQFAVFVGYKNFSPTGVSVLYEFLNEFDSPQLAPKLHTNYNNNIFSRVNASTKIMFVLCKSEGSKRRFVRDYAILSADEYAIIKKLWESKMITIDRNGKILKHEVGSQTAAEAPIEDVVPDATTATANPAKFMYISPEINEAYYFIDRQRKQKPESPVKVLMVGPSGYGKSTIPQHYAEKCNLDFFRLDCATIRDPEEWFGQRVAENGSTAFHISTLAKKLQGGNVLILLDEINRLETWLTNALYAILDDARGTTVYDGIEIKLGQNIVLVATINLGHNYSGTFTMDAALSNRFEYICEVSGIPFDKELEVLTTKTGVNSVHAKTIIQTADLVRQLNGVECSIRTTLMIATQVALGMSPRNAFQSAVILRCSNVNVRKQAIDVVNQACGIYKVEKSFFK